MNDLDYIHIQNWMGKRLGLRGNLLLCFALIHGYSRNGNGVFKGSLKRLSESMFCTEPTVIACLDRLIELQLITKKKIIVDGHERCLYAVSVTFQDGELVCIDGTKEILVSHTKEILVSHTKESLVNNKYNNKENNKEKRLSNDNQKKDFSDDFLEFWKAYGYSRDKATAYKRWQKLTAKEKNAALKALPAYFEDCARCKRDKRYPAVYLNKRTWEDDFSSQHDGKEEKEEIQYPAGMDEAQWTDITLWMCRTVPRIAGKITPVMFGTMKTMAGDSRTLSVLLREVDEAFDMNASQDVMEVFNSKLEGVHDDAQEA